MFKLKNKFKTIYFCLITFIGLLFVFNNHKVVAMHNQNNNSFEEDLLKNRICEVLSQKQNLSNKILQCDRLNLNTINLKKQLKILDVKKQNIYRQLGVYNTLNEINKQIWDYSNNKQQLFIKIINSSNQEQNLKELNDNYKQIIEKNNNLQKKYQMLIKTLKL
ncbi:MAG: SVM family protein [Phytoplasma sp.]|uniref:SVM family protein n=1 Tax=Phytoplasma sp. TaxID=2155 RepID=UPI002B403A20|nr:SVM family protein [Phytoplasma sp.]WRH06619.1 MAG: SVM family protein [Phytoplasma sp.]